MVASKEKLRELASKYLNEEGQEKIEEFLDDNNLIKASEYVLGAIDHLYKKCEIDFEEAKNAYQEIGIDSERASQLRQSKLCM